MAATKLSERPAPAEILSFLEQNALSVNDRRSEPLDKDGVTSYYKSVKDALSSPVIIVNNTEQSFDNLLSDEDLDLLLRRNQVVEESGTNLDDEINVENYEAEEKMQPVSRTVVQGDHALATGIYMDTDQFKSFVVWNVGFVIAAITLLFLLAVLFVD